jgi:DnaJ-class molecular chaperone
MEKIEICNIWKSQCYVSLKHDEELCPLCKGQGALFLNASFKRKIFTVRSCRLCMGEGKIGWITRITKKLPLSDKGLPIIAKLKDIKIRCTGPQRCKKTLKRLWLVKKQFVDPGGPYIY